MKPHLLLFGLVWISMRGMGQVLITPQLPTEGLTLKSQLWNLSLVNSTGKDLLVEVQMTVTDRSVKQRVLTATSGAFDLPKGATLVRSGDLPALSYTSFNPAYSVDLNPSGFLPIGVFVVCYTVVQIGERRSTVAEDCQETSVEPLGPPMLISPADSEQVEMDHPLFIWTPPAPQNLFSSLRYDFKLAEVVGRQSAGEALQRNIPLLLQSDILTTSLQYGMAYPVLDSSKVYAWQVTARNGAVPVAVSEAWAFRLKKVKVVTDSVVVPPVFYSRLRRELNNAFVAVSGIVRCSYLQEVDSKSVHINLYDITSSDKKTVVLEESDVPVNFGENRLLLDLRQSRGIVNHHFYLLELVDPVGGQWYLKFQYVKK